MTEVIDFRALRAKRTQEPMLRPFAFRETNLGQSPRLSVELGRICHEIDKNSGTCTPEARSALDDIAREADALAGRMDGLDGQLFLAAQALEYLGRNDAGLANKLDAFLVDLRARVSEVVRTGRPAPASMVGMAEIVSGWRLLLGWSADAAAAGLAAVVEGGDGE